MAAATTTSSSDQRKHLYKIVNDANSAFMVTHHNGRMHGRPMQNAKVGDDATVIYFATQRRSGKVEEIERDSQVYLGYTNPTGSEWASVNGTARVVDNRAKIKELWSPVWKNWFEGPDDPNLVLIEVTPDTGEYWDNGSKALQLVKFAITAVTGKRLSEGEHAEVKL
jgi:general stress protein 26